MIPPEKTTALVVGIESYAVGPHWNLDGPVPDAERFVRWLLAKGVRPERIHCALSPLPRNRGLVEALAADLGCDGGIAPGERMPVQDLVHAAVRWSEGEHLVVFWGGHGVMTRSSRRLLLADSSRDVKYVLPFIELLDCANSDFTRGHRDQAMILDVCGTFTHRMNLSAEPLPVSLNKPGARGVDQYVLCATHPGQAAENVDERATGAFSERFLDALDALTGDQWPPPWSAVGERLQQEFEAARARGESTQMPQAFDASQRHEGEIVTRRFDQELALDESPVLDDCDPLIVTRAELARVRRLIAARGLEAATIVDAALAVLGGAPLPPGHEDESPLEAVARELASLPVRRDGRAPLLEFVERIAARLPDPAGAAALREWTAAAATKIGAVAPTIAAAGAEAAPELHLLVLLTRVGRAREVRDDHYRLRAWSCRGASMIDVTPDSAGEDLSLAAVPDCLETVLDDLGHEIQAAEDRLVLEFILPGRLLSYPAQSWERGGVVPLGEQWPVLVRPFERLKQQACWSKWERRWDREKTRRCDPASLSAWVIPHRPPGVPEVRRALADEDLVALRLAFVPGEGGDFDERLLKLLLYEGVGIAMWPQVEGAAAPALRARLEALFTDLPLSEVPEALRRLRREALVDPAIAALRDVALLWDDPERIPPEFRPVEQEG